MRVVRDRSAIKTREASLSHTEAVKSVSLHLVSSYVIFWYIHSFFMCCLNKTYFIIYYDVTCVFLLHRETSRLRGWRKTNTHTHTHDRKMHRQAKKTFDTWKDGGWKRDWWRRWTQKTERRRRGEEADVQPERLKGGEELKHQEGRFTKNRKLTFLSPWRLSWHVSPSFPSLSASSSGHLAWTQTPRVPRGFAPGCAIIWLVLRVLWAL